MTKPVTCLLPMTPMTYKNWHKYKNDLQISKLQNNFWSKTNPLVLKSRSKVSKIEHFLSADPLAFDNNWKHICKAKDVTQTIIMYQLHLWNKYFRDYCHRWICWPDNPPTTPMKTKNICSQLIGSNKQADIVSNKWNSTKTIILFIFGGINK